MQDVLTYHSTGKHISCRLWPPSGDQTDAGLSWEVGFSRPTSTNLCLSRVLMGPVYWRRNENLCPCC